MLAGGLPEEDLGDFSLLGCRLGGDSETEDDLDTERLRLTEGDLRLSKRGEERYLVVASTGERLRLKRRLRKRIGLLDTLGLLVLLLLLLYLQKQGVTIIEKLRAHAVNQSVQFRAHLNQADHDGFV